MAYVRISKATPFAVYPHLYEFWEIFLPDGMVRHRTLRPAWLWRYR